MTAPDAFFAACNGTHPVRLAVDDVAAEFAKPCVVVGAGPGVDVDTGPAGAPPARKLYLQLIGGHVLAVPLPAADPVLVNGRPAAAQWATAADVFQVGRARLRVVNPSQGGGPPPPTLPVKRVEAGPGLYTLECLFPTAGDRVVEARRPVWLAGRAAPAKLQVPTPELLPVHAAFVHTNAGTWVVSLAPPGGLTVDGEQVAFLRLRSGAVVGLGPREFRFRPAVGAAGTGVLATLEAPAVPAIPGVPEALLDHIAQMQQQTFDQFQQVLASVATMVGSVLADQRAFVKEELDRMERLMTAQAQANGAGRPVPGPGDLPPPAVPSAAVPAPPPRPFKPPTVDVQLHSWVQQQLDGMAREQDTLWQRLKGKLRGGG